MKEKIRKEKFRRTRKNFLKPNFPAKVELTTEVMNFLFLNDEKITSLKRPVI